MIPVAKGHLFIIGAQRSATTQLAQQLESHPNISMAVPNNPEPKWFLDQSRSSDIESYLRTHFPEDTTQLWLGEKSTSYLEMPEAAERISVNIANPQIFVVLRDPTERAISNFYYSVMNGVETRSVEEALSLKGIDSSPHWTKETFSVSPYAYLERGLYFRLLAPWLDIFGEDLHVLMFEDVILGCGGEQVASCLNLVDFEFDTLTTPVNSAPRSGPQPTSDLRQRLNEFFKAPNKELADAFGLNISHWSS